MAWALHFLSKIDYTLWGVHSVPMQYFVSFFFKSSSHQFGCAVDAVSAQRPVEHVKNAIQNISTEWTPHGV